MTIFNENVEVNGALEVNGTQDAQQLQVKGHSAQTQPLQTWENSAGDTLVQLTADGRLEIGDTTMDTPAALVEANRSLTFSPTGVQQGWQSRGRISGAISGAVAWIVHELELLGTGGVSGLHAAMRGKLFHNNTGDATNAQLRAGDFEAINQSGTSEAPVGQLSGVRGTANNQDNGFLSKAVGVEGAIANDATSIIGEAAAFEVVPAINPQSGNIGTLYGLHVPDLTQGQENFAIYTGTGLVHLGDSLEVKRPTVVPGQPQTDYVRLYPKSDGKLYAKNWNNEEYDLTDTGDMTKAAYDPDNDGRVEQADDADTLDGQHASAFAGADHNHDSAYAAAAHTHDDRYFTEAEHIVSSAGVGSAGKPIKLNASGKVDDTMLAVDASEVTFTPSMPGDWPNGDPGNTDMALNNMGSRVHGLEIDMSYHAHDNLYFRETEHIATSSGAGDAGKPIKLNASGKVDATMLPASSSDSTLSDTYVNLPAASNAGDLFLPSDAPVIERDTGAAWEPWGPLFKFKRPSTTGFGWTNQGSATVAAEKGILYFVTPSAGALNYLRCFTTAAPSTPYTLTVGFRLLYVPTAITTNQIGQFGIVFRNSSSGKIIWFNVCQKDIAADAPTSQLRLEKFNSATSASANYLVTDIGIYLPSIMWLRLANTGTNRVASVSIDGQHWLQMHSVSNSDFTTTNEIGVAITCNGTNANTQAILYHWEVS